MRTFWGSITFATWGSWVRIPSSPPRKLDRVGIFFRPDRVSRRPCIRRRGSAEVQGNRLRSASCLLHVRPQAMNVIETKACSVTPCSEDLLAVLQNGFQLRKTDSRAGASWLPLQASNWAQSCQIHESSLRKLCRWLECPLLSVVPYMQWSRRKMDRCCQQT